ncbi:MAG TPA: PEP-CTERM sorting domain-containing protein [Burkholderiaceae bacterium]
MKIRHTCHLAVLGFTLALSSAVSAQSYTATLIPSTPIGSGFGYDINALGQIAGSTCNESFSTCRATLISADLSTTTDLGGFGVDTSQSNGLNNSGQVVGTFGTGPETKGFVTGPNGQGFTEIITPGGKSAGPSAINDAGAVTGSFIVWPLVDPNRVQVHAFIWTAAGGMVDIGTLGGISSTGHRINQSGQIVGSSQLANGVTHAFLTGANGVGMNDLGALNAASSNGYDLNDSGQVVGMLTFADGSMRGFMAGAQGQSMVPIGLAGFYSGVYAVNNQGVAVGQMSTSSLRYVAGYYSAHAFVTGPGGVGITDLNDLVALPDGHYFIDVFDINDAGQILAIDELDRSYLLTPVPEPSSLVMLLLGGAVISVRLRRRNA